MNLERYKDSTAGRVIKVGQGDAAYWAFVPEPLPPSLTFEAELINILSQADQALGELAGLGRSLSNPQILARPFVRREAVLSSRIEGTQADITDLYAYEAAQLVLPTSKTTAPEADVKEVLNYVRALEYGIERLKSLPMSVRLLRELHERLMQGVRGDYATPGEFRRSQNWIGKPNSNLKEATYVPPPIPEMNVALSQLEKYIHSQPEYPPLIRIGLIHYEFEAIHPFLDGNGRIGRLLISLLLADWNLLPQPLLYLSAFFEQNRQQYYRGLRLVSQHGAWHEWLLFFLKGVTETARSASQKAKQLQDLQIEWQKQLQNTRASALTLRILDELFNTPVTSPTEIQENLKVTHAGASRALQKLVEAGIIQEVTDKKRSRIYVAEAIVKILE